MSADLQVSVISKYTEVTEASEALVSTMAYHTAHKQYDQDMDLSQCCFNPEMSKKKFWGVGTLPKGPILSNVALIKK